jgi:hypothetical protein
MGHLLLRALVVAIARAMIIQINLSALKHSNWRGHLTRFLFGGAITVLAGLIANQYGPVLGGLFLAFPAVFPASAILIAKQETRKKARAGFHDPLRGTLAAALEARGAAMGAVALCAFALLVWRLLPQHNAILVLLAALGLWWVLAALIWELRRVLRH